MEPSKEVNVQNIQRSFQQLQEAVMAERSCLQAEIERLELLVVRSETDAYVVMAERDRLKTEIERLKAEVLEWKDCAQRYMQS